jgi:hypothetical protein
MMTYSTSASFTANAWCNPASLAYSWTSSIEGAAPVDWSPRADYQPALVAANTASYTYAAHESDYDITNVMTVSYTPEVYSQKDVSASANASYTHEQTCRPKIEAGSPTIQDDNGFVVGSDITINFGLNFATTGY